MEKIGRAFFGSFSVLFCWWNSINGWHSSLSSGSRNGHRDTCGQTHLAILKGSGFIYLGTRIRREHSLDWHLLRAHQEDSGLGFSSWIHSIAKWLIANGCGVFGRGWEQLADSLDMKTFHFTLIFKKFCSCDAGGRNEKRRMFQNSSICPRAILRLLRLCQWEK